MLADAEAKVASLGEILAPELIFLDLQAALDNFLGLGAPDGNVHGDLLVTADAKRADGVTGFA